MCLSKVLPLLIGAREIDGPPGASVAELLVRRGLSSFCLFLGKSPTNCVNKITYAAVMVYKAKSCDVN